MFQKPNFSVDGSAITEKPYRADVCNICGSQKYRRIHYFKEWNLGRDPVKNVSIVQCQSCKVRRRMPEIIDDYEAEYQALFVEHGQNIHPHQLSHFSDLMTARLKQLSEKNITFLDVGCSTGRVLRLAATLGFQVAGLEYSKWAAEYCEKLGFSTRQGNLIGQWKESQLFNIIHCSHTIEHVPDPVAYLCEMHRLLKKDGQLMIACPNYASLPRMLKREKWAVYCLDSHLWQFTRKQMSALLIQCGFTLISVRTLHGYTPDSHFRKKMLDVGAAIGWGDGLNVIATRL